AQAQPPMQRLEADEEMLQLEMELVQLHQRLEEIQQSALANNPALKEEAGQLGELMVSVMEEEGFSPQQNIERIHQIQVQLQQPGLEPEDRIRLMEEAQAEYLVLEQAQAAAVEREEVQAAHQRFQENVVSAMQQEEPETDEISAEFTRKQQEYEQRAAGGPYTGAALRH